MTKQDEGFALEPSTEPGHVPARVIDELRRCYREARDYTGALSDALKAQAEKHQVAPGALRKFVAALEGDKVGDAAKEAEDLARLICDAGGASVATDGIGNVSVSIVPQSDSAFANAVRKELLEAGAVVKSDGSLDVTNATRRRRAKVDA